MNLLQDDDVMKKKKKKISIWYFKWKLIHKGQIKKMHENEPD